MIKVCSLQGVEVYATSKDFREVYGLRVRSETAGILNPYLRPEIASFPTIRDLVGPMYDGVDEFDGTIVRYETQDAYDVYSV